MPIRAAASPLENGRKVFVRRRKQPLTNGGELRAKYLCVVRNQVIQGWLSTAGASTRSGGIYAELLRLRLRSVVRLLARAVSRR